MKIAGYRPLHPGTQPDHLHPPYVSSIKRSPTKPQIRIPLHAFRGHRTLVSPRDRAA